MDKFKGIKKTKCVHKLNYVQRGNMVYGIHNKHMRKNMCKWHRNPTKPLNVSALRKHCCSYIYVNISGLNVN